MFVELSVQLCNVFERETVLQSIDLQDVLRYQALASTWLALKQNADSCFDLVYLTVHDALQ